MSRYRVRRLAIAALGGLAILAAAAGPAAAHVGVDQDEVAAGSYANLTFTVPHGCDGSPTTAIAVQIPEGITSLTPGVNPSWTIVTETETLATPIDDGEGGQITERVGVVSWTGGSLPDEHLDRFVISVQMPDQPDERLFFPVVQTCERGETAWIEESDGTGAEPEHPAPSVLLTDSEGGGHGAEESGESDESEEASLQSVSSTGEDDDSGTTLMAAGGLGAGLVGLVLAAIALVTARRSARQPTT
ncbi:MAG: YcnI family protein [Acidimicrobiales bacterium]